MGLLKVMQSIIWPIIMVVIVVEHVKSNQKYLMVKFLSIKIE
jgi:hypothetical protein